MVDELEAKYADFPGLNLTYESREGILKHCSASNARQLGELGERFLERRQPGLEAQIANLADAVAYNNHDVDDGLRAGLLGIDQLRGQTLFADCYDEVRARYPELEDRRLIYEIIRRMIDTVVTDMIDFTQHELDQYRPETIDDVRTHSAPLVAFSEEINHLHSELKRFLNEHLYRHENVRRMTDSAKEMVEQLFTAYLADPGLMPADFSGRAGSGDQSAKARVVADYIAGMTDRYAIKEYERLSG